MFLDGLDGKLDKVRGDGFQMQPFTTIDQAYAHIRQEAVRQAVMTGGGKEAPPGVVLASKGLVHRNPPLSPPILFLLLLAANPTQLSKDGHAVGLKCSH